MASSAGPSGAGPKSAPPPKNQLERRLIDERHSLGALSVSPMKDWIAKDRRIAIWSDLSTFLRHLVYPDPCGGVRVSRKQERPFDRSVLGDLGGTDRPDCPLMVVTMVAVHGYAPRGARMYSLSALGFMIVCASLTTSVHFIVLLNSSSAETEKGLS
jgi:hypothetical protein